MIKDLKYFFKGDEDQKIITKDVLERDQNLDYQGLRWINSSREEIFNHIAESVEPDFCVLDSKKKYPQNFIETKKGIFDFNCYYYRRTVNLGHSQLHNCCRLITDNNFLFLSEFGISNFNFFQNKSTDMVQLSDSESLSYSKEFNLVSGANQLTKCYLYDLKNKKMLFNRQIFGENNGYENQNLMNYSFFLDEQKSMLAAGNSEALLEIDLATLESKNRIKTRSFVNHVEYEEKYKLIGCAMDDLDIELIDIRDQKSHIFLKGHDDYNFAVKFLDNHKIATGGQDVTTRIWDIRNYDKELFLLDGFQTEVAAFEYIPEKNYLFVLELFGYVYGYDLNGKCVKRKSFNFFSNVAGMSLNLSKNKLYATLAPLMGINASGIVSFSIK